LAISSDTKKLNIQCRASRNSVTGIRL
jgi:hypothetical protein